jgi:hypothetical protein
MPHYPYAIVPHPIGVLEDDQLRERARQAAPQVANIVLNNAERPSARDAVV